MRSSISTARTVTLSNSGLPYPIRCTGDRCAPRSRSPECRSASSEASPTTRSTLPLQSDDLFVFYTDGILDAVNESGAEFGAPRLRAVVGAHRTASPGVIVDAIFEAVAAFRGHAPQADDMTAVVVRMTE